MYFKVSRASVWNLAGARTNERPGSPWVLFLERVKEQEQKYILRLRKVEVTPSPNSSAPPEGYVLS